MRRLMVLYFAGLAAITIMAFHTNSVMGQQLSDAFLSPSRTQQATIGVRGQVFAPVLPVQGRHYSANSPIPPSAPDYGKYYGYDLPAYPPYASGLPLRDYIPYGWYDYLLRHLDRHEVCPPWSTYPYEC